MIMVVSIGISGKGHREGFFFFFNIYLFVWIHQILVATSKIFTCGMQTLSYSMWDLVPWPGIEPGSPALGAQSLSHWTTREVPMNQFDYFPRDFISKTIFTFYCHTRVLLGAKAPTSISINMLQFLRWKKLKTGERSEVSYMYSFLIFFFPSFP